MGKRLTVSWATSMAMNATVGPEHLIGGERTVCGRSWPNPSGVRAYLAGDKRALRHGRVWVSDYAKDEEICKQCARKAASRG